MSQKKLTSAATFQIFWEIEIVKVLMEHVLTFFFLLFFISIEFIMVMLVLYLISARLLIAEPFYHWHNSIRSVQTDVSRFPAGNTILSKHISNCYVVPGLPVLNPICFMAYCQLTIWSSPNHPALVKAVRSFRWTEMDNPCDTVRYSMTYWRLLTYKACNCKV